MRIVTRVTIVACSLAMGLLVSECLFRFVDIAPHIEVMSSQIYRYSDNPQIGWEPVPLAERKASNAGINDLGYRDLNHPMSKPPGVLRIIVIGDSIAQGTGIRDEEAIFPRLRTFERGVFPRRCRISRCRVTTRNRKWKR